MQFENILTIVIGVMTIVSTGFGIWKSLANSISDVDEKLNSKSAAIEQRLNDFKLEVAKEYASISYMKDVEERLVGAIKSLSDAVNGMPDRVAGILAAARNGSTDK